MTRYVKHHQPTCSKHQSAIQKMGALRECSNIFVWLIYAVRVSEENSLTVYQKSGRAIQRVFALTLQPRHSIHKELNYQHPVALKDAHKKAALLVQK